MARTLATGRTLATNRVAIQDMQASLRLPNSSSGITTGIRPFGSTDMAVCAWIKLATLTSGTNQRIAADDRVKFFVHAANKTIGFSGNGFSAQLLGTAGLVQTNRWLHVAVSATVSGNATLYVNGVSAGSGAAGALGTPGADLFIGRDTSFSSMLDGRLKNISGYNRTLTQAEVIAHMNGATLSGAAFSYSLNEGTGTTATDTSGNGNNGTITNGAWSTDTPTKARNLATGRIATGSG